MLENEKIAVEAPIGESIGSLTGAALERLMALPLAEAGQVDEVEADQRERRLARLREAAHLPERAVRVLGGLKPDWWEEKCAMVLASFRKKPGVTVAFYGLHGRGKTVFACALGLDYLARGKSVRFLDLLELEELYDAARGPVEGAERAALEFPTEHALTRGLGAEGPALLILDECGKSRATDYVMRKFFLILNQRYNADLDTILIGNLQKNEFEAWLDASLTDRLNENGGFVEFKGEGMRK